MGLSLGLRLGLSSPSMGGGYSVARFIADMTADGQWATLDAAYVFDPAAGAYEDLTANNRDLTVTATVTQTPGRGVYGDGVTGKLLGLGAANALTNGVETNVALTVMVTKAANQSNHLGRSAASGQLLINAGPTTIATRLHAAAAASIAVSNSVGATTVWRDPTDLGQAYFAKDATYLGKVASTSAAPNTSVLAILNSNAAYCTDTVFAVLVGAGVTQAQALRRNAWLNELARSRGWRSIPAIGDMGARSAQSAVTHPDGTGSTAGKGITCTGLCPDGSGGFWCGNDGRGEPADTTFDCGVRHYTDATLASFTDFYLSAGALGTHFSGLGIATNVMSVQGVSVLASGQIQFVAKHPGGANSRIVRMNADGTNVSSAATTNSANGLAFDPVQGLTGLLSTNVGWYEPNAWALTARTGGTNATTMGGQKDHLWIDPTGAWMLVSGGSNGVPGTVEAWSLINDRGCPIPVRSLTLTDTLAIEGICIVGSTLYANSDQYFHPPGAGTALNLLQTYDATGLLDPF